MPSSKLAETLDRRLADLDREGRLKGPETVIRGVTPAQGAFGPRYLIEGDTRPYLRMNSNDYLGLSRSRAVIAAEGAAAALFGAGPGAVRFIGGTFTAHKALEARLAAFHGRGDALLFSSAYAAMIGVLPALITPDTAVFSDALNHNCIVAGLALARPAEKYVYGHLDLGALEQALAEAAGRRRRRALIVTDGVFSMRGDHAPLAEIMALARRYDSQFAENVVVIVDDSHGVGAFGATGRGVEEHTAASADILIATLGKAFGVNGGYVAGGTGVIRYLRETATTYVYSNPITAGEAAAALAAVECVESDEGRRRLAHLRAMTARFRAGLAAQGLESVAGEHPVAPLLLRDSQRTRAGVAGLRGRGVLATGLTYPVVPRGEEEIRFQISADHTSADVDAALAALAESAP